jgi:DNA-binding winged helix-turn-helix (wHTH) protein/tetratricopeptide (TPR) repeat protein
MGISWKFLRAASTLISGGLVSLASYGFARQRWPIVLQCASPRVLFPKTGCSPMPVSPSQIGRDCYEFGPFRLDPEKQTLLRDGKPIALTPKAFQLLLALVRRSNRVVTKDELMKSVWPDTFVEETNLTRNIFALRKALGGAEQNRYIVTVPGQGYRFAGNVHHLPERELDILAATQSTVQVRIAETKPGRWVALVVVVLLAAAAGTFPFFIRKPILTEKDTVVLADFANSTGDSVFDGALRQGMAVQLEQSPFLSLISEERIRRTLVQMGQSADAQLTGKTAREVCERTGAGVVTEGSIATLGGKYVLGLRAQNCRTGSVFDEEQEQVARKEDVLNALNDIARKFRIRAGESLATVEKYSTPLAEATTPSLEALKAYSTGWQVHALHGASAALPFLRRATEIDPQFAVAYASLGRLYADLDQRGLAAASIARASQLRDRASDRERFFITSNYEILVTGNLEAAQQTCEAWALAYPREAGPHTALASIHKMPGRYEEALAEARKAIELEPDFWVGYYNLGVNSVYLGRLKDGEGAVHAAAARGLDADEFIMLAFDIAFLNRDQGGMEREAARARARPGGENWISAREALVEAYSGHLQEARNISHRAVLQAQQAGQSERASLWAAGAAVREALFGNKKAASEWALSALKLSNDREVEYGAALAFAFSGDSSRAQALVDRMEKRFPEDSSVRFNYLPTIRAVLALNRAEPERAVEFLELARPHELGTSPSSISGLFGALYPIYVRGQAYLAASQGAEAAAEFQKILDHRGVVVSDPIAALTDLQLGRAYALLGDKTKAKSAYQDFLVLWKDADGEIPVLKQAKEEYAKLK